MNDGNPWKDSAPFAPMFTDAIKYQNRNVQTQIMACAFPISDIDPIADFDAESEVRKMSVSIQSSCFTNFKPVIGDRITLPDGSRFGVAKVELSNGIYTLTAKEI